MEIAICDANIVIDFLKAEGDILTQIAQYFDKVYIPDVVVQEVGVITEAEISQKGFVVINSRLDITIEKGLSFQDSVCLDFVRRTGCCCITNDRRLRKFCQESHATVIWGYEMLLKLVNRRLITKQQAKKAATQVKKYNLEMTDLIFNDFLEKLSNL